MAREDVSCQSFLGFQVFRNPLVNRASLWFPGFCILLSRLEWAVPFLRADIAGSGEVKGATAETRAEPGNRKDRVLVK